MKQKNKKKLSKDEILIFFLKNRALTLVLLFFIVLSMATDAFLTSFNLLSLARQISANCIIAVGYTFLLASDSVDLSAGYTLCLVGIISGLLSKIGAPFIVILIVCVLVGVGCGMLNSTIITKFNLAPFLVTLAMQQIYKGAMMLLCNGTPIGNLNDTIIYIGQGSIGGIPFCVILMLVFLIVGAIILTKTQFGRDVIAIGGNSEAARVSGINVAKTRLKVGALLGFTIAITALVSCGRVGSAQTSLGADTVMDIIAAVVIGGTPMGGGSGTVIGSLFGCLVIGLISNGLNLLGVNSFWQMVSKGIIILIAVILDVFTEKIYDRMRNKA